MKTHLCTILEHCLQVYSAAYATAAHSPMQACTRTVSWVRRIMLCFFPRDLREERELRWSYSWTKQRSVAQRESGEQRVTCVGPPSWYPSERRGEQTKHTSVARTIMPSSSRIHGAHASSSEVKWARVNNGGHDGIFEEAQKSLSRALIAGMWKLRCRHDRIIRFCGRRSINQLWLAAISPYVPLYLMEPCQS